MRYKLVEDGRVLHTSGDINRLINYTARTKNALIYFGDILVWVQRPERYTTEYHSVKA